MPSSSPPRPRWHTESLDALRGIAVLAVIMVHTASGLQLSARWSSIAYSGQRGVQLFFIVSAFTLCLSSKNRTRAEHHPTRNFFIRRFFRLAPMYYLDILYSSFFPNLLHCTLASQVLGVLFLEGWNPRTITAVAPATWSLADEAMFYLCLPLLLLTIRSFRSAVVALLIATPVLNLLSLLLIHHDRALGPYFAFLWFPIELPIFLLGIAAYFFWSEKLAGQIAPASPRARGLSLLLLAGFFLLAYSTMPLDNRTLVVFSLGCALLLLALVVHPWKLLVNPATVFLGRISYSVYLLHAWWVIWLMRWTEPFASRMSPAGLFSVRFFGTLIPCVALGTLTWFLIEEQGIRAGGCLIARLEHRHLLRPDYDAPRPALHPTQGSSPEEQF